VWILCVSTVLSNKPEVMLQSLVARGKSSYVIAKRRNLPWYKGLSYPHLCSP
jgi:hypothetical protein